MQCVFISVIKHCTVWQLLCNWSVIFLHGLFFNTNKFRFEKKRLSCLEITLFVFWVFTYTQDLYFEIFQKHKVPRLWKRSEVKANCFCIMNPKTQTCEHCMCWDTCRMCTWGVRVHLTSLTLILIITLQDVSRLRRGSINPPNVSDRWLFRKKMHLF